MYHNTIKKINLMIEELDCVIMCPKYGSRFYSQFYSEMYDLINNDLFRDQLNLTKNKFENDYRGDNRKKKQKIEFIREIEKLKFICIYLSEKYKIVDECYIQFDMSKSLLTHMKYAELYQDGQIYLLNNNDATVKIYKQLGYFKFNIKICFHNDCVLNNNMCCICLGNVYWCSFCKLSTIHRTKTGKFITGYNYNNYGKYVELLLNKHIDCDHVVKYILFLLFSKTPYDNIFYEKPVIKKCKHRDCLLVFSELCCFCSDKRNNKTSQICYEDGKGDIVKDTRINESYCPVCKNK